jgi:methylmalonyl-CoA/ethylmalonyl-CoA epimerase
MPNLSAARIGQIAIVCKDVARARDFYRDTLGLPHLFDVGPNLSFLQCGDTRLMLSTAEPQASGTSVLYFFIHDMDMVRAELEAKGVRFITAPHMIARMPDHELWLTDFHDSEGNVMALMEEKR